MKAIILPGNGKHNKDWGMAMKNSCTDLFSQIHVMEYEHWKTGEEIIDFQNELTKFHLLTKYFDEYIVIAKSAGSILAMMSEQSVQQLPKRSFFCGIPIKWAQDQQIPLHELLRAYSVPTTVIQNTQDPFGTYKDLLSMSLQQTYDIHEWPYNDHEYMPDESMLEVIRMNVLHKRENST